MNTVINHASGKPSNPLRGCSYVHDSKLRQPRQIAATIMTMHKMLSVKTVIARSGLCLTVTTAPYPLLPEFPSHPLQNDTK